jgi:pyridoxine 4-dehydrogenase
MVVRSQLIWFLKSPLIYFPGEFYGKDLSAANLDLLAAFYEDNPGYADKTFLSVKGGVNFKPLRPDAS